MIWGKVSGGDMLMPKQISTNLDFELNLPLGELIYSDEVQNFFGLCLSTQRIEVFDFNLPSKITCTCSTTRMSRCSVTF